MTFLTWTWNMSISVPFAILGMICIGLAFWPGFYNTWKTKDTRFLPIKLFSLFLLVGILMTAGSIAGIWKAPEGTSFYVRGWCFVLLNAFVMFTNLYTVGLWFINRKKERLSRDSDSSGTSLDSIMGDQDTDNQADSNFFNAGGQAQ